MKLSLTTRRLLPLYAGQFCQGIVFWYAIEKVFMVSIGFDNATIGLAVAICSAIILVVEVPSGILADRWSRKGTLMIAGVALALSSFIAGLSSDVITFIFAVVIWGIFYAAQSGTSDSIIYDTLLETEGTAKNYKKYLGRIKMIEGAALVIAALTSGLIASFFGLRETFFWTLPFAIASIIFLAFLHEPKLHKLDVSEKIFVHVRQTLHAVVKRREMLLLLAALVSLGVVSSTMLEFNQLWFIALMMPVLLYGPLNSLVISSFSISGFVAQYMNQKITIILTLIAVFLAGIGLVVSHNFYVVAVLQTIVISGIFAVAIVLTHQLHDNLPSHIRAGASSTVSTLTRMVVIPFTLLFGFVASQSTIFIAMYLLLVVIVASIVMTLIVYKSPQSA